MDTMVSARVPVEVKRRGDCQLKQIGSSVSELINSAYDYLFRYGELPGKKEPARNEDTVMKVLTGEEARKLCERLERNAVLDARAYDEDNFKQLLNQARSDYYARFA